MRFSLARLRRFATPTVLCVATATIAAFAATSPGFPVRHVDLNDGGIWVTDNAQGMIGRFNNPIGQLDGSLTATSAAPDTLDVQQNGDLVAAWDKNGGRLYAVDVTKPAFTPGSASVDAADIALGGRTVAVLGTDGSLRAASIDAATPTVAALDSATKPLAKHLTAPAGLAVSPSDAVYVAAAGQLRRYLAGRQAPTVTELHLPTSDPLQVTTVGDVPVVADSAAKVVVLPQSGRVVHLGRDATNMMLQQPSPQSRFVGLATASALYSINLATGQPTTLSTGHGGDAIPPVQLDGCVHAAWLSGVNGTYLRACGDRPVTDAGQPFTATSTSPVIVFRVNRDALLLNDTTNGTVFMVNDVSKPINPNWQQLHQAAQQQQDSHDANAVNSPKTPLIARPDQQGVRPGRSTVVHVLDNDKGANNDILVVTAVSDVDQPQVKVTVSPDAQTVLASVGSGLTADAHFQYTIQDGYGRTAHAAVTLTPVAPNSNRPPATWAGYRAPHGLAVAGGGTLTIPVIGDWRDPDGDSVYVDPASVAVTPASAGTGSVTATGAVSFVAAQLARTVSATVRYAVTDGIAATPTATTFAVRVVAPSDVSPSSMVPPTAQPDVAQGVVGLPVTLHPLANDLPGADPTDPQAQLKLAAPVSQVDGAIVSTDLDTGVVTVTPKHVGPITLGYTAAFGAARTAHGTIRIEAIPPAAASKNPVAMPDVAVIHGQQPAVVDVLANDYDPQGQVLGVESAASTDTGLQVFVVRQRWLRISSINPQPGHSSTVSYTVTNGSHGSVGSVSVTAVPADPRGDQIMTRDDSIVVRAGDSAAVAVLANDASSTGLPLTLGTDTAETSGPAGVVSSVQGSSVRVTAPATIATETQATISYTAADAAPASATGHLRVTIEPAPNQTTHKNQPPRPQNIDTRETAGDVLRIPIPVYGIDPDGDSGTVVGITIPPTQGRIVSVDATSISYQSYPTSDGTDTFTYKMTDQFGGVGTGEIRVGILPPGPPQQPVAVDDVVNAPPGAHLHVDVMANDLVPAGDLGAHVLPLQQINHPVQRGVSLQRDYGIRVDVPQAVGGTVDVAYELSDDSGTGSVGHLVVRAYPGATVAPVARNDIATPPRQDAATVTVDVLRNDDDPAGDATDLTIVRTAPDVSIHGASLTIPVKTFPREVPYTVKSPNGAMASAVVYVPGSQGSVITLKKRGPVQVAPGGTVTVPLSSVLNDSAGRPLKITTTDRISASPAGDVTATAHHADAFVVRALGSYTGPGAVTVRVFDGGALQDPNGHTATLTIPIQVGRDVPVMRCPQATLPVIEGGVSQRYDIAQLCHVWIDTTVTRRVPTFDRSWARSVNGVSADIRNGRTLQLSAASSAHAGAVGSLRLTPVGATAGSTLSVVVVAAPLPTGRPVVLQGVKQGQKVTVDLTRYVTSPLPHPQLQVTSVTHPANATVSPSGSTVSITPAATMHGTVSLQATVSDVPNHPDRAITIGITVNVLGKPGAPGQPTAVPGSRTISVSWPSAPTNGASIDQYAVVYNGKTRLCGPVTSCVLTGLTNGTVYDIVVRAQNSVGWGPDSGHAQAKPDQLPDQVGGLSTVAGNGHITLNWAPVTNHGGPMQHYLAEIQPAPADGQPVKQVDPSQTTVDFAGLTNKTTYTFRVEAVNTAGAGPWSDSVTDVPYGKPLPMAAPKAAGAAVPDPSTTRAVTVSWSAADDNGRPITGYTVREYSSNSSSGPWSLASTVGPQDPTQFAAGSGTYQQSFTVGTDGTWYVYTVTATNQGGESDPSPDSSPAVQGAAPPDAITNLSAKDHDSGSIAGYNGAIHVDFTVPKPNAGSLKSIQYGLNAASTSGTWTSFGAVGTMTDEAINGLTNGSNYVVYVRGCNDAGMCGPWAGPSNKVSPYTTPGAPSVSASASGNSITYNWSGGGGGGRPIASYTVCIDGGCSNQGANAGSTSQSYSCGTSHSIYAYVTDSVGQKSGNSNTATASTAACAPPPMTVSVSNSGTGHTTSTCTTSSCTYVEVTVNNAQPGATMNYACYDNGSQFWPYSGTISRDYAGNIVTANASGYAQWQSQCVWGFWGSSTEHLQANVNGTWSP